MRCPFTATLFIWSQLGSNLLPNFGMFVQEVLAQLHWHLRGAPLPHLNNIQSPIRQQLTHLNHLQNPQRKMPS